MKNKPTKTDTFKMVAAKNEPCWTNGMHSQENKSPINVTAGHSMPVEKSKNCNQKKFFDEFTAIQRSANFRKEACTRAAVQPDFISYESSCFETTVILSQ